MAVAYCNCRYSTADCEAVMALARQGASLREIALATGIPQTTASRMRAGRWQPPEARPNGARGLLGRSPLTAALDPYLDAGASLDELTVQKNGTDPFRTDTAAGHAEGQWLADTVAGLGVRLGAGGSGRAAGPSTCGGWTTC